MYSIKPSLILSTICLLAFTCGAGICFAQPIPWLRTAPIPELPALLNSIQKKEAQGPITVSDCSDELSSLELLYQKYRQINQDRAADILLCWIGIEAESLHAFTSARATALRIQKDLPLTATARKVPEITTQLLLLERSWQRQTSTEIGCLLPDFEANTLSDERISARSLQGKYVFILFWESSYPACQEECGLLQALTATMPAETCTFVSISLDTDLNALKFYTMSHGFSWPQIYDRGNASSIAKSWGIIQTPTSFLVDPDGRIFARNPKVAEIEHLVSLQEASRSTPSSHFQR